MNRNEILNIANDVWEIEFFTKVSITNLVRFAKIVAESERRKCAELRREHENAMQQAIENINNAHVKLMLNTKEINHETMQFMRKAVRGLQTALKK
jgi:hypothetical protein